jgi:hypothetical protein
MPTAANAASAYDALEKRFRRLNLVRDAVGVLQWDMAAPTCAATRWRR